MSMPQNKCALIVAERRHRSGPRGTGDNRKRPAGTETLLVGGEAAVGASNPISKGLKAFQRSCIRFAGGNVKNRRTSRFRRGAERPFESPDADPVLILRIVFLPTIAAMFFRSSSNRLPVGSLKTAANSLSTAIFADVPARKRCRERKITGQAALGKKPWFTPIWEKTCVLFPGRCLYQDYYKSDEPLLLPASGWV